MGKTRLAMGARGIGTANPRASPAKRTFVNQGRAGRRPTKAGFGHLGKSRRICERASAWEETCAMVAYLTCVFALAGFSCTPPHPHPSSLFPAPQPRHLIHQPSEASRRSSTSSGQTTERPGGSTIAHTAERRATQTPRGAQNERRVCTRSTWERT